MPIVSQYDIFGKTINFWLLIMSFLVNDSTTQKPCNAKMWASLFSFFVCFKYLLGGVTFGDITIPEFDSSHIALPMAMFLGNYSWRAREKKSNKVDF